MYKPPQCASKCENENDPFKCVNKSVKSVNTFKCVNKSVNKGVKSVKTHSNGETKVYKFILMCKKFTLSGK